MQETPVRFLDQEDPLEKGQATHPSIPGLAWWLRGSRNCLQCRRLGFDPWVGNSPWKKAWQPTLLFLSGESPWTEETGRATVHRVTKSWTWLSDQAQQSTAWHLILWHFLQSRVVHISICWYLMSHGLHRWLSGKESACQCRRCRRHGFNLWVRKIPWRRKWQPPAVFLPAKSHGQSSLVSYSS